MSTHEPADNRRSPDIQTLEKLRHEFGQRLTDLTIAQLGDPPPADAAEPGQTDIPTAGPEAVPPEPPHPHQPPVTGEQIHEASDQSRAEPASP